MATKVKKEKLLKQYECGPVHFSGDSNASYERHLTFDTIKERSLVGARERYEAIAHSVRDLLSQRWIKTEKLYNEKNPKRVYYLSMEYLIGRSLANNITNLMIDPIIKEAIEKKDLDWVSILESEPDAGLGNGGLGRLAACFLDSMATLKLPAMGYGLRYEYGIFKQEIENGWQVELPDNWLNKPDPWEIKRLEESVEIHLNCSFEIHNGKLVSIAGKESTLLGVPYDRPVVGFGGETINTLRLFAAAVPNFFDFQKFGAGNFVGAIAERLTAETITRVLYPDDRTMLGQALRFVQEYFLVACSLGDIVRRFRKLNKDWSTFPEKVAIQMNDTHPALAVPELMRILLDEAKLSWDEAWTITQKTLAYTNHTLLPEALETWPVRWFTLLQPRLLEIIYEINTHFLEDVRKKFPDDLEKIQHLSLIDENEGRSVRMANLAVVGSHSTNGVAKIHSELLQKKTLKEMAEVFPERFNNKTNGVTQRRWLLVANPPLAKLITDAIGDEWVKDLTQLKHLKPLANAPRFCELFLDAKLQAKQTFCKWLKEKTGQIADPFTIFDCQVKRIHEYKRQLLNALRIIVLYNRLKANPNLNVLPRTFFFAGKAAPAYDFAKLTIKFLNNLAGTINNDPTIQGKMKVFFIPDYSVSLAEKLIPATDISNQISTAGYEASGTSNMKFMMNGALTLGTRDGATIEMAEEAGEENFSLFGLSAEQATQTLNWYSPYWHYEHEEETRAALELIASNYFSQNEPNAFIPLYSMLLSPNEKYLHLADLKSYLQADQKLCTLYANPKVWASKAVLNIAASGKFSSDRTIHDYASEIWNVKPCPID